jgi:arylsulfatase A-like enzyme
MLLMTPPALERLARQGDRPLFLYLHFNDPHAPYDRGGPAPTPFEAYLKEIALVDQAIGRIRAAVDESGLADRTAILLVSDHGEAFGEHGQQFHATTLYDVMIRVAMIVHVPGARAREVDTPVSLIDVAPTVLDLMGTRTPGSYMGQSLVPFIRGRSPFLQRPIVADSSRLQRAMVFADGMKIIEDRRKQTVELYDLVRDPGEEHNLVEERETEAEGRLSTLRAFFAVHALRRPGYEVPFGR